MTDRRTFALAGLATLCVVSLLVVGLLGWVWLRGIEWRDPPGRERALAMISALSGAPVEALDAITLRLSGNPVLSIDGLVMGEAMPTEQPPRLRLARLARLQIEIDLAAWLLHGKIAIRKLRASDLELSWHAGSDAVATQAGARTAVDPAGSSMASGLKSGVDLSALRQLSIDSLEIDRIALQVHDAAGGIEHVQIARLSARAPAHAGLDIHADGQAFGRRFNARLDAGELSALADPESSWPVDLLIESVGASLAVSGSLEPALLSEHRSLAGEFSFGLGTPDAQRVADEMGARIPDLGPAALAGRLHWQGRQLALSELVATLGRSQLYGHLAAQFDGARLRVDGQIDAQTLDLAPYLGVDDRPAADSPRSLAQWYRDFADARIDLSALDRLDANIDLKVERWLGLPAEVGQAHLRIDLQNGVLAAPIDVHLAGVDLHGDLGINARAAAPELELNLGTADTPLGGLAQWLFGVRGINGALGGVAMRVAASGRDARALLASSELRLVLARGGLSYGNRPDSAPVSFGLDSMLIQADAGAPVRVQASGNLLDQPFDLALRTDSLQALVHGVGTPVPVRLRARSRSVRLRLDGELGASVDGGPRGELLLALDAGDVRDLSRWTGLSIAQSLPLRWRAKLSGKPQDWRISDLDAAIGGSRVRGRIAQHNAAWTLSAHASKIDLDEIERLFSLAGTNSGSLSLNMPILPARLPVAALDMDLRIDRILRSQLDLRDLSFTTRFRDGLMSASPMALNVLGIAMQGALEIDLRGVTPRMQWWLHADKANIGALLRRLSVAERIDAQAQSLRLHLSSDGKVLGELLAAGRLNIELEGGRIELRDPNAQPFTRIEIANGSVNAQPGQDLHGAVLGRIGEHPVALAIRTGPLAELLRVDRPLAMSMQASVADAQLSLQGQLERPLGKGEVRMQLAVLGQQLDDWDRITGLALPPWGPYALKGALAFDGRGYRMPSMSLTVGQSLLRGNGQLQMDRSPPELTLSLDSPGISVEDFRVRGWSPFQSAASRPPARPATLPTLGELGQRAAKASDDLQQLFSARVLARLDSRVEVRLGAVNAGGQRLGTARLGLRVANGRARFDPVEIELGEGRAMLTLDYAPGATAVDIKMKLQANRIDYGLIAKAMDPASDLAGQISAELALSARAPALSQAMRHGSGSLRLLVQPRSVHAGVFDLWASNLFFALASRLDPDNVSTVNCGIGEFDLSHGVLRSRQLLIDTTRVRMLGSGRVDFGTRELEMRLRPWPKRAEFFSLATPIRVDGGFDSYQIGPGAADIAATAVRLLGSVLWVPAMKLLGRPSPADGADVCTRLPSGELPGELAAPAGSPPAVAFPDDPLLGGP